MEKLKVWVVRFSIAIAAAIKAYTQGRKDERTQLENEENERRNAMAAKAKEIRDEVNSLDDDSLVERASEWVRDTPRK